MSASTPPRQTPLSDRAAVARFAHQHGLHASFATDNSVQYEQGGRSLTVTYDSTGGLIAAFYIRTPTRPGVPLPDRVHVISALAEMAPTPDETPAP
ncbi:hypothetical protein [Streptosporangium longisporum]|uniref:Uncharacterized protein n=1 Tax=Streptosporangium longisporum TaxID=46187 RepID=A0ABP6L1H8_9ACTN